MSATPRIRTDGAPRQLHLAQPVLGNAGGIDGTCHTAVAQAGLGVMLKAEIDRMRRLQERVNKEQKALPGDLVSASQRTFGKKGAGIPSLRELKKAREQADKLNGTLQSKGCPTIDIDQAFKRMGKERRAVVRGER